MIVLLGLALGAIFGAYTAYKRGGNKRDMAQYAAGFAIAFMLVGLFVTIFLERALT
ncbi:MAG: apolipoprotein acyltransferase [Pseudotabrizicola sp.]|uniref:apolipoprotein acyltransferase n=1 Tax=Pseudotabrizicola sp. TaxID=2939647 RepID=UPI0027317876|nr:apolipoprotein acyltransferase [Pseudotabrizicola sp.]MDP2079755.1 apolipoprotein acyltransferase [Pseudotabrizicola sp.]MDZ7574756.1 apolipoprotein acyltransferase [Pseudotabrizicola sp.]